MSEQLLLLNPRSKRRAKRRMPAGLARYWRTHKRHAANPRRRKRRAQRRHQAVGYTVGSRPIRRRKMNRRRVHARRARYTNPRRHGGGGGAMSLKGSLNHYVIPGIIGGAGTLALDVVYGYVSPHLPENLQTGWFGVLTKLGVILGAGMALNKFAPRLRSKTQVAVLGATTVLAYGAIKQAAASMIPAGTKIPGLSGYGMGAYVQDFQRIPVRNQMGAYMPRSLGDYYSPAAVLGNQATLNGLNAYMPPRQAPGVAGFDYMSDGM